MADRQKRVKELTEHIYHGLDLDFVRKTGSLFATSTLRHAATRQQFSFMKDFRCQYDGRLLTERVTTHVCTQLLDDYQLEIPTTPGHNKRSWIKDTSKALLALLQKARRSYCAMDNMETQPWALEEDEDCMCV
ncbi:unnamed protein product [Symbiodinium sp. CCMP2592]|nr:unnamed protein product [Symbiodinium sp. CCMP2592]